MIPEVHECEIEIGLDRLAIACLLCEGWIPGISHGQCFDTCLYTVEESDAGQRLVRLDLVSAG
jgi:hypothetical protein